MNKQLLTASLAEQVPPEGKKYWEQYNTGSAKAAMDALCPLSRYFDADIIGQLLDAVVLGVKK